MTTIITYAGKPIDFREDLSETFAIPSNVDYLVNVLSLCRTLPFDTITPLNPSDTNYMLFVKSLVHIRECGYDHENGFELEFNTLGRPFQQIKKIIYKKIVQSYNKDYVCTVIQETTTDPMAKKDKSTAITLITNEKATALFESVTAQISIVAQKCKAVTVIETAEQGIAFGEDVKQLNSLFKDAEKIRKEAKDPFKIAGEIIDASHGMIFDPIERLIKECKDIISVWNAKEIALKAQRDHEANLLRQEEERKANLAKSEIGQAGLHIIQVEKYCIEDISKATTQEQLGDAWQKHLEPMMNFSQFGALAKNAEEMYGRMVAFGGTRDSMLVAPSPEKETAFTIEKSKVSIAQQNAEQAIYTAIAQAQTAITNVAETNKSNITQEQIADKPVTVASTRRSPIKYQVIDILQVPAQFTMTVINEEAMKQAIHDYAEQIDANPNMCPGIRFYRDENVVLK